MLAVLVAWAWIASAAGLPHDLTPPTGHAWQDYLAEAWWLIHDQFPKKETWRDPLYMTLVGVIGEAFLDYGSAAVLVSAGSALALIAGSALGARALAGPWAGVVAAFCAASIPSVGLSVRWATIYTLLAGASSLTVGLALALARWPRLGLAAATGLVGGLAWATDGRGALVLPMAALCVALATWRRPGPTRVLLPLLFAAGLGLKPWADAQLRVVPVIPFEQRMEEQREVGLRWVSTSNDPEMKAACQGEPKFELPNPDALTRPCAREVLRHNLSWILPNHWPAPGWAIVLGFVGLLLPGRHRGSWLDAVAFVGGLGACWLFVALWVPMPTRYVLQFLGPLALVAPAGVFRHLGRLPRLPRAAILPLVAAAACVWVTGWVRPSVGEGLPELRTTAFEREDAALSVVEQVMGPDDLWLDCSLLRLSVSHLPTVHHDGEPMFAPEGKRCLAWIQDPPQAEGATTWVSVGLKLDPHTDSPDMQQMKAMGWEHRYTRQTFRLFSFGG